MSGQTALENLWHDATGASQLLGLQLFTAPDGVTVTMQVTSAHTNRHGNLHGGLIGTVLDTAMGATASYVRGDEGRVPFSTISMNVNFVAPMPLAGTIIAKGRVVGGGHKIAFIEALAHTEDGTLVAQATGTFKRAPI